MPLREQHEQAASSKLGSQLQCHSAALLLAFCHFKVPGTGFASPRPLPLSTHHHLASNIFFHSCAPLQHYKRTAVSHTHTLPLLLAATPFSFLHSLLVAITHLLFHQTPSCGRPTPVASHPISLHLASTQSDRIRSHHGAPTPHLLLLHRLHLDLLPPAVHHHLPPGPVLRGPHAVVRAVVLLLCHLRLLGRAGGEDRIVAPANQQAGRRAGETREAYRTARPARALRCCIYQDAVDATH